MSDETDYDIDRDVAWRRHFLNRFHLLSVFLKAVDQKRTGDSAKRRPVLPKRILSRTRHDLIQFGVKLFVRFDQMIETLSDAPRIRCGLPIDLHCRKAAKA